MKAACFRSDALRKAPGGRGIERIPVEQLDFNMDPVLNERVDVVFQLGDDRVFTAFALNPIPTRIVRAVLVLSDTNEIHSGIEHTSPPPAVPRDERVTRQV